MHESPCRVNGHHRRADRFYLAVVRTAFHDVLQRDPTPAELALTVDLDVSSGEKVLMYYQNLLCSPEFVCAYVLVLSLPLLARLVINQIAGRAPLSQDEIDRIAVKMIEAGWFAVVRNILADSAMQQRIFGEIQRTARHAEPNDRPFEPAVAELAAAARAVRDRSHGTRNERQFAMAASEPMAKPAAKIRHESGKIKPALPVARLASASHVMPPHADYDAKNLRKRA